MKTLLLDAKSWDLVLDAYGNIAVADTPYAEAQDAASAIKLFKGESYYAASKGVDYFEKILGLSPTITLMKKLWGDAALTVPNVETATVFIASVKEREVTGQVQIHTPEGLPAFVTFINLLPPQE